MAIESTLSHGVVAGKREYPYLASHKQADVIVLFISENQGTVLKGGHSRKLAEHRFDWVENEFEPLATSESVTLRNL